MHIQLWSCLLAVRRGSTQTAIKSPYLADDFFNRRTFSTYRLLECMAVIRQRGLLRRYMSCMSIFAMCLPTEVKVTARMVKQHQHLFWLSENFRDM